ncbi:MAG: tetratricopeptide repeat protein, partial [Gemmatimonadaceae bacterium]
RDRAEIARALTEATAGTRKAEQTTDFMLGLFEAAEQGKSLTDTVTARELLNRGLQQARELSAQPEMQAQMFDVIGRLHTQLGNYDEAQSLLEQALALRRRLHGNRHPDVATSLENLANVATLKQDIPRTVELRRQAYALRQQLSGVSDSKTMDALYELAFALHQSENREEADRLFNHWIAQIQRQPPVVTATRADQLAAAAALVRMQARPADAEAMYRHALSIRRAVYGDNHHVVAGTLVGLALAVSDRGRPDEADSLLEKAVDMLRATYPGGHPELASALRFHGSLLMRHKRFADAIPRLREALAMKRHFLGPDALDVANTSVDLSHALASTEQYQEAEEIGRDALRIYRKLFDDRNAMVYLARISIGDALTGEHRFDEAEPLLLASYSRFQHPNPITKAWRADALSALVRLYNAEGKRNLAMKYSALADVVPARPAAR